LTGEIGRRRLANWLMDARLITGKAPEYAELQQRTPARTAKFVSCLNIFDVDSRKLGVDLPSLG